MPDPRDEDTTSSGAADTERAAATEHANIGEAPPPTTGAGPTEREAEPVTREEVEDFAAKGQQPPSGAAPIVPGEKRFDIEQAQENTRGIIAGSLIALLFVVIIFAFGALMSGHVKWDDVKGLLELTFGPLIALVGSATGFYFGGKKS